MYLSLDLHQQRKVFAPQQGFWQRLLEIKCRPNKNQLLYVGDANGTLSSSAVKIILSDAK